jgi:hypothetical protein
MVFVSLTTLGFGSEGAARTSANTDSGIFFGLPLLFTGASSLGNSRVSNVVLVEAEIIGGACDDGGLVILSFVSSFLAGSASISASLVAMRLCSFLIGALSVVSVVEVCSSI